MLAIDRVLDSPELLEAGEYALLKQTLFLNGNLLAMFDQMPPNLVNEIGAGKIARWKSCCSEMHAELLSAYHRRVRWTDVPAKSAKKSARS